MNDVLLIIDMQRDFGAWHPAARGPQPALPVPGCHLLIDPIRRLHKAVHPFMTVATQDWHDDGDFGKWPPHCAAESLGADLHHEVCALADVVARKPGYSAFTSPELAAMLRTDPLLTDAHWHLCGVALDVCVLWTALEARNHGRVTVYVDCCAAVEQMPGDTANALDRMAAAGVVLARGAA